MSDHDPLQTLWKSQPEEPFTMSLAEVRTRAERFQSRVRRRNWIEYGASVFVVVAFGFMAAANPAPLVKLGALLIIAATLYVCWKLATMARAAAKDEAQSWADFHRAELIRQRDALRSVWRWYLGPFIPGMVVFVAGTALSLGPTAPLLAKASLFGAGVGFVTVVFVAIGQLNAFAARQIEREIAALDRTRTG
ncbi:MAG: hypothetical protein AB7Q23_08805 [Hyphomonadaceae bacterium]